MPSDTTTQSAEQSGEGPGSSGEITRSAPSSVLTEQFSEGPMFNLGGIAGSVKVTEKNYHLIVVLPVVLFIYIYSIVSYFCCNRVYALCVAMYILQKKTIKIEYNHTLLKVILTCALYRLINLNLKK